VSTATTRRPATGARSGACCHRARNASFRFASINAIVAAAANSQSHAVPRRNPDSAFSACVSHGSVCRLC
jgi:hypothetical protein